MAGWCLLQSELASASQDNSNAGLFRENIWSGPKHPFLFPNNVYTWHGTPHLSLTSSLTLHPSLYPRCHCMCRSFVGSELLVPCLGVSAVSYLLWEPRALEPYLHISCSNLWNELCESIDESPLGKLPRFLHFPSVRTMSNIP